MKPKIVKTKRLARALVNAQATWLSLVDHGANATPFRHVKQAGQVVTEDEKTPSIVPVLKAGDETPSYAAILSVEFDPKIFKSEKAVHQHLSKFYDSASYTVLLQDDGSYIAISKNVTEKQVGSVSKVSTPTSGVTARIGFIEADFSDDSEEQPQQQVDKNMKIKAKPGAAKTETTVAKSEDAPKLSAFGDLIKKYDYWAAYMSGASSLEEALKAGLENSPTPPGFYEVMDAASIAMANAIKSNDVDALASIGEQFGTIIGKLSALFKEITGSEDEPAKKIASALIAEPVAATPEPVESTPEPVAEPAAKEETPAIDVAKLTDDITARVSENVKNMLSAVVDPLVERMGKVEKQAPVSKASVPAGVEDFAAAASKREQDENKKANSALAARQTRNTFGF